MPPARAAVKAARINLDYTKVTAPIAGRIGSASDRGRATCRQTTATLLATVQQLDPIYVDVTQSSTECCGCGATLESGG